MSTRDDVATGKRYGVVWRCGVDDLCVQPQIVDKTGDKRETDEIVWAGTYIDGKEDLEAATKADAELTSEIARRTDETITKIDADSEEKVEAVIP